MNIQAEKMEIMKLVSILIIHPYFKKLKIYLLKKKISGIPCQILKARYQARIS